MSKFLTFIYIVDWFTSLFLLIYEHHFIVSINYILSIYSPVMDIWIIYSLA